MSLDVYLAVKEATVVVPAEGSIYIREDGEIRQISRAEWQERFPGQEPVIIERGEPEAEVFWANITHNLNEMAMEVGLYEALWRPEEIDITKAGQLVGPLSKGLAVLAGGPQRFRALNPPNGWGDYEGLVHFVSRYLAACVEHPDAYVRVSR